MCFARLAADRKAKLCVFFEGVAGIAMALTTGGSAVSAVLPCSAVLLSLSASCDVGLVVAELCVVGC